MVWLPVTTPANMNLQGPNRYQQQRSAGETEAQRIERLSHCRDCNKKLEPTEEHPSFKCPPCSSRYCSECLESMFKEALKYGGIWPPVCYYCVLLLLKMFQIFYHRQRKQGSQRRKPSDLYFVPIPNVLKKAIPFSWISRSSIGGSW